MHSAVHDKATYLGPSDRPWRANLHTLRVPTAKVTVIRFMTRDGEGIEGAAVCPCLIPEKSLSLWRFNHLFSLKTLHLFALAAEDRRMEAIIQVSLVDSNR